jgi:ubiquinone/menaquinone biosynthesis C-methylase UbiE
MGDRADERHRHSKLVFKIITLMHDNPLLPILRDPYKMLERAGLRSGQTVLEVGCGPGHFTIPAARIVGEEGVVYAIDTHPLAIERVNDKIKNAMIRKIKPILSNASDTGLPDRSIDLAFLFGLPHVAGGLDNVLSELHRVLKPDGTLSFQSTRGSGKGLVEDVVSKGFEYCNRKGRMFIFKKE